MTFQHYQPEQLSEIVKAYQNQKLMLIPTDTVYGLSALFGDPETLHRLKSAKGRLEEKPIPVAVSSLEMACEVAELSDAARILIDAFLPGPLTLIVRRKNTVDPVLSNGRDTLAIRIPNSEFMLRLIEELHSPLFLTSANRSGESEARNMEQADALSLNADGLIEGVCDFEKASTIVDVSQEEPVLLREGPISFEEIKKALKTAV